MEAILTSTEVRVLGAMIEKELTTPEYYPLSLNALTNACNQKSNREPVLDYDEKTVLRAAESLREKNLAAMVTGAGSRVVKYKHGFGRRFQFDDKEVAALCVLFLRGPQTIGEIRGRSGRLYPFESLAEVQQALNGLMARGEGAYVMQLPRQPGRKESRYAHLFCGEPDIVEELQAASPAFVGGDNRAEGRLDRMQELEETVASLATEIKQLRQEFDRFREQFD